MKVHLQEKETNMIPEKKHNQRKSKRSKLQWS